MAPPPVARTMLSSSQSSRMALRSRTRKPASPSTSKIHAISAPVRSSMYWSESWNVRPSSSASRRPIVVLPAPMGPTRNMLRVLPTRLQHVLDDRGRDKDQQLGLGFGIFRTLEQVAQIGQVA